MVVKITKFASILKFFNYVTSNYVLANFTAQDLLVIINLNAMKSIK